MHRVLLIDEILRGVFEHIDGDVDVDRQPIRYTFASLARVCQAWRDPALDFLWRFQHSTDPLFSLIPGAVLKENTTSFDGDISPESLAKFFSYASRVRTVAHHSRTFTKLSPAVLTLLRAHHSEHTLLPALTSVRLILRDAARRHIPPTLYLSGRLRDVSIDISFISPKAGDAVTHPGEALCAYLDEVARVATGLQHLRLRGRICERMAETVATMAGLRTLSLCVGGDLTPRALSAIASFPYLEDLRIQLDGMDAGALAEALHPCSSSAAQIFPSLQVFRVRSAPSIVEVLFGHLSTSNILHTLHLESDFKPRPVDDWIPAFTLLASKTHATLTSLSIESLSSFCEVPDHAFPPKLHFTLDTLRPLARLARLEHFSIDPSVPADLSDADLAALARWFPAIASLGLWTHPVDAFDAPAYFSLQPRATAASLAAFATHCPRLRELALPMD
ncbi:hypothetical protein HETIRDRAFT_237934, partial [Heterobasidion irregulare TC 32-1]